MSESDAAGDRSRTFLLVGLGVVAVAALVAFVIMPLLSGGDEEADVVVEDGDVVVVDEDASPEPTPTEEFPLADPEEAEDGGNAPEETFEVFNARDPFDQLVEEEAATDGTGGTGTGTPPTGTPTTGPGPGPAPAPTTGPAPNPTTSPNPTVPGDTNGDGQVDGSDDVNGDGSVDGNDDTNGDGVVDEDDVDSDGNDGNDGTDGNDDGSAEVGGTTVTLVDVFTDDDGDRKATITVNGTAYTVGEGDTFARRFRLLDISGRCTTMLFGDSRFTLCEGERIRK